MTDSITVRGYVATEVRLTSAQSGLAIAGFRMCTTERRLDRETNTWVDGHTNWYSVSLFRQLATNAGASLKKGDRVIVTGRLKIRPWSTADGRTGTSVEIDADTVGHDLMWGTANYRRTTADRSDAHPVSGFDGHGVGVPADDMPEGVDAATGEVYDTASDFGSVDSEVLGEVHGEVDGVDDGASMDGASNGHGTGRDHVPEAEAVPF
ncbi:single-stranded DNA-binding protein [Arthrobacter sp. MDT2-16]|uniref:single-stranded DNA-binding protein n=1 Tax=Arthrobacter ruber TaxID=1258893 RepID=UPI000CF3E6B9|nr:single-stranded DNA-binding protein [Arthrobacter ruber]